MCFGIDQAKLLYRNNLINLSSNSTSVLSPCMPKNFEIKFQTLDILRSPCGNGRIENQALNLSDFNVTLMGSSDFKKCRIEIRNLLRGNKECQTGQDACSFKSINFPDTNGVEFYVRRINFFVLIKFIFNC